MNQRTFSIFALCTFFACIAHADDDAAIVPFESPRESQIPGNPGMPGMLHVMANAFGYLTNPGLAGHTIKNAGVSDMSGGATRGELTDDWLMFYDRHPRGWVEGFLMLDFEPFTVGSQGIPELGQSGEGLWDAQHPHQFLHQAMLAFHPLSSVPDWETRRGDEPKYDLSIFGGQGSATIGPPIFMHRASAPGPDVPRKHHKGENPHETFPVIGTSLRLENTWFEASAFSARELTPEDSRIAPHVGPLTSVAARMRHVFKNEIETQVSFEHLRDQGGGEPDAWQMSSSVTAWGEIKDWRIDALLDWAIDAPQNGPSAQAFLDEVAVRSPDRKNVLWVRSEFNQREESPTLGGGVSSLWVFDTLGVERIFFGNRADGMQLGIFSEATAGCVPDELRGFYGRSCAISMSAGLHFTGMKMFDHAR